MELASRITQEIHAVFGCIWGIEVSSEMRAKSNGGGSLETTFEARVSQRWPSTKYRESSVKVVGLGPYF